MKIPDGYISILHSNDKGTEVTVEQKELVFCKHCKHYVCEPDRWQYCILDCEYGWEPDDFCSYGERKEGGDTDG